MFALSLCFDLEFLGPYLASSLGRHTSSLALISSLFHLLHRIRAKLIHSLFQFLNLLDHVIYDLLGHLSAFWVLSISHALPPLLLQFLKPDYSLPDRFLRGLPIGECASDLRQFIRDWTHIIFASVSEEDLVDIIHDGALFSINALFDGIDFVVVNGFGHQRYALFAFAFTFGFTFTFGFLLLLLTPLLVNLPGAPFNSFCDGHVESEEL